MSLENGQRPNKPRKKVNDKEGSVDEKLKTRIIEARNRVDKAENSLFVEAETDPNVNIRPERQVLAWATIVKQFLRTIEPILRDHEVVDSKKYYKNKKIGEVVLAPPQVGEYDFSIVTRLEGSPNDLRRALGLPRGADIPQPKTVPFQGLESIIETDGTLEEQWVVAVDKRGPQHEYVYPQAQTVVPKHIFENAIRYADRFLQQAGIGLDVSSGNEPIIRNFDQSGNSAEGDLDAADYRGDPDI